MAQVLDGEAGELETGAFLVAMRMKGETVEEILRADLKLEEKALGDLRELTESVREKGVLEPLLVKYIPREDTYYIISGERRYRAATLAQLKTLACVVVEGELTQEVLVVLHEKYARVSDLTELVPLAFQVLRFKMLDAHRKAFRRGEYNQEPIEDLPLADPADDPAAVLRELLRRLMR